MEEEITNTKSERILVVDDNEINRILLKKMLSRYAYQLDFCENGEEACQKIVSKEYDVVLMDVHMPIMNGLEATKQIRSFEDPYFKQVPIIALTASVISSEVENIYASGLNDYQTKPFKIDELVQKISNQLNKIA